MVSGQLALEWALAELHTEMSFYAYLGGIVLAVFSGFGWWFGCREERLRTSSGTDPLTGLANRRQADEQLNGELARVARYGAPLSLMLLDLDEFKKVNDVYGHRAGDDALRTIARILDTVCRDADILSRYGGDEFVVIAPSTCGIDALALGQRICDAVSAAHWCDNPFRDHLTISAGVVDTDHVPCLDAERLLAAADEALYEAKSLGGNRAAFAGGSPRPGSGSTPDRGFGLQSVTHP